MSVYDIKKWAAIPPYEWLTNFYFSSPLPVYCIQKGSLLNFSIICD